MSFWVVRKRNNTFLKFNFLILRCNLYVFYPIEGRITGIHYRRPFEWEMMEGSLISHICTQILHYSPLFIQWLDLTITPSSKACVPTTYRCKKKCPRNTYSTKWEVAVGSPQFLLFPMTAFTKWYLKNRMSLHKTQSSPGSISWFYLSRWCTYSPHSLPCSLHLFNISQINFDFFSQAVLQSDNWSSM